LGHNIHADYKLNIEQLGQQCTSIDRMQQKIIFPDFVQFSEKLYKHYSSTARSQTKVRLPTKRTYKGGARKSKESQGN